MSSSRSPITCHVLDSSLGKPAKDIQVVLQIHINKPSTQQDSFTFDTLANGSTDSDGRCSHLLEPGTVLELGVYKIIFKTQEYFESTGRTCFYPFVEISFNIVTPSEHYHVPLLISPYSYTTYRGS